MKKGPFHFAVLISLALFYSFPARAAFEGYLPMSRAERDLNGIQDLLVFAPNAGNGMAPSSRLDERGGRSVLLETWGFYSNSEKGIDDLLELKRSRCVAVGGETTRMEMRSE